MGFLKLENNMGQLAAKEEGRGSGTSTSGSSGSGGSTTASTTKSRSHLHSQLRKTKICNFHLRGACQFGEECAFAHTSIELQPAPDLSKTRLCRAYANGGCTQRDCTFAHGEQELRAAGVPFKNAMCLWNKKGKCRKGELCRFAHSVNELCSEQPVRSSKGFESSMPEPMKVEPTGIFMHPSQPRVPTVKSAPMQPTPQFHVPDLGALAGDLGALAQSAQSGYLERKSLSNWEGKLLYEDIKYIQNQIAALSMTLLAVSARSCAGPSCGAFNAVPPSTSLRRQDGLTSGGTHTQGLPKPYLIRQGME
mmetsp:Transcript_1349/g.3294  ORF Transcript_1349/g.3294 Transcript_1349/m.3294 type:complete len:307 (-) Transcript_1349:632-1552(-)|eukprot:CAMPEP_0170591682 /NCGR_PEP_ID=MMETSP0224-20130122/12529_1 /TAXON_ID=285029 /ORGANISM="Togula jolla, Strain CCCM 725" /LENGTH=306 /DNA_ID=CAMNT_0010915553 /DNA_START=61 /DNA_END=981 /DNA_ORIENTATION=+